MINKIVSYVKSVLTEVIRTETNDKMHEIEIIGKESLSDDTNQIITVQIKSYTPIEKFGERGYYYKSTKKDRVRKDGKMVIVDVPVKIYALSEGEKNFIYKAYVNSHLTQKQISTVSGIPQDSVYRYIKQKKLKPNYVVSRPVLRTVSLKEALSQDVPRLDPPGIKMTIPSYHSYIKSKDNKNPENLGNLIDLINCAIMQRNGYRISSYMNVYTENLIEYAAFCISYNFKLNPNINGINADHVIYLLQLLHDKYQDSTLTNDSIEYIPIIPSNSFDGDTLNIIKIQ